jgi:hypothetical protein
MLDLSEEPDEENIEICAKYFKEMAPMKLILEMEIGITGGEPRRPLYLFCRAHSGSCFLVCLYAKEMAPIKLILKMEIGTTGGEGFAGGLQKFKFLGDTELLRPHPPETHTPRARFCDVQDLWGYTRGYGSPFVLHAFEQLPSMKHVTKAVEFTSVESSVQMSPVFTSSCTTRSLFYSHPLSFTP